MGISTTGTNQMNVWRTRHLAVEFAVSFNWIQLSI